MAGSAHRPQDQPGPRWADADLDERAVAELSGDGVRRQEPELWSGTPRGRQRHRSPRWPRTSFLERPPACSGAVAASAADDATTALAAVAAPVLSDLAGPGPRCEGPVSRALSSPGTGAPPTRCIRTIRRSPSSL